MNKIISTIAILLFMTGCDTPINSLYPGDARGRVIDGNCSTSLNGMPYTLRHEGTRLIVSPTTSPVWPSFTADMVSATGNEVLYIVNDNNIYGEMIWNPDLERFTVVRIVHNNSDYDVFETSVVCDE